MNPMQTQLVAVGKSKPSLLYALLGLPGGERGQPRVPQRHRCHINCELHDHHLTDASTLHEAMLSSSTALNIGTIDLSDMDPDEIKVSDGINQHDALYACYAH